MNRKMDEKEVKINENEAKGGSRPARDQLKLADQAAN